MAETQRIIVEKRGGCGSGCATFFAIALVVGLVATYWYVAVPVAVLALAGGLWWFTRGPGVQVAAPQATATTGRSAGWYPDPLESGMRRYWDGTRWTDSLDD